MLYHSAVILLSLLAASAQSPDELSRLHRLGSLSPYHKAPTPKGIKQSLPPDCKVEQVMFLSRHGSRYPSHEAPTIQGMAATVAKAKVYIAKAKLPRELHFLKGYESKLGDESLVEMGRQQLFSHGVEFRKQYHDFAFDNMNCSGVERVIESTDYFGRGYFGNAWTSASSGMVSIVPVNNVTVSHITPWATCANLDFETSDKDSAEWQAVYLPPITGRINSLVAGLNFTVQDTLGALYACGYDYAARGESPWCRVFTDEEIDQFEYDLDLGMSGMWGARLTRNRAAVMGSIYINTLIERFSRNDSKPIYVEFGHDVTISLALTTLGLTKYLRLCYF